ncbi:MAG: acyl-CoA dehydrogenase [Proteobacteria bacterium]|nr:acyl-CoA dehydrogenase [Pseudomonadota bacterium]
MAEKFVSLRNLNFLLYEVLDIESLSEYPYFEDHGRETFEMLIDTSLQIAKDLMQPAFVEMDTDAPEFKDGTITVHPAVRAYLKELGQGGWIGAGFPFDDDGQQFPATLLFVNLFIASAANFSLGAYPGLTSAAAHLLLSFASPELKEAYMGPMLSGEWQGTMAMTEPSTGSATSDLSTSAEPTDDGYYLMRGQKIFISAGDHDGVDNTVHMMLARINDAPNGAKGISLFAVPKHRVGETGGLEFNDVSCTGVYHKMGYRGCPIAQLSLGDNGECRGYLVGEAGRGLEYMFQMLNEVRLDIGAQATGCATAAYYDALEYTRERLQGRKAGDGDPNGSQIPIIEHADIKRMLLFQRAVAEGSLSLVLYAGKLFDLSRVTEGEESQRYRLLLDLLTPVVKSYPAEMGVLSTSQAIQCLGGYGYCNEFPLEQHFRNSRIHPIHGGTTGIQGIDLLGRKIAADNAEAFAIYTEEVEKTVMEAGNYTELQAPAQELEKAQNRLREITDYLMKLAGENKIERLLSDATLFLELFGIVTIAWQWLEQGIAAQKGLADTVSEVETNFYQGKMVCLRYFINYELPKIEGLAKSLLYSDGLTVEMDSKLFFEQ